MSFVLNSLFLVMIFCCFSYIFYQSFFSKTRKGNAPHASAIKLESNSQQIDNSRAFTGGYQTIRRIILKLSL